MACNRGKQHQRSCSRYRCVACRNCTPWFDGPVSSSAKPPWRCLVALRPLLSGCFRCACVAYDQSVSSTAINCLSGDLSDFNATGCVLAYGAAFASSSVARSYYSDGGPGAV